MSDYDNHGDLDILVGNEPLATGKIYSYMKTLLVKEEAGAADWKERVILEAFVSHDMLVGVDGDGDLDIVSKEWTSGSVYYLENKLR